MEKRSNKIGTSRLHSNLCYKAQLQVEWRIWLLVSNYQYTNKLKRNKLRKNHLQKENERKKESSGST